MDFKMDNVELLLSAAASEEAASATARTKKGGIMPARAPKVITVSDYKCASG
jgi:hypothetical protein